MTTNIAGVGSLYLQYLAKFSARDRSSGLTVTITDPSGARIAATGTATVVGITTTTQTITQDAGAPFSGTIGTFTNSNDSTGSDSYSAYVNWGDGTWLAATVQPVSAGSNTFDIVSTNPSGAPGTYNPSGADKGSGVLICNPLPNHAPKYRGQLSFYMCIK